MRAAALMRTAFGLVVQLAAAPASAQMTQYWLPNGPGGTTYNNPQGSLSGTYYNNAMRRQADQLRWQQQRRQSAGAMAGGGAMAGTVSRDPSFRLNNSGGRTIREVYVSAATDSNWGIDRLGADVLAPGQAVLLRLPQGQCVNDVRVVFMDGQAQERRQVNTCALTDLAFR
jgi:hypothetical protein